MRRLYLFIKLNSPNSFHKKNIKSRPIYKMFHFANTVYLIAVISNVGYHLLLRDFLPYVIIFITCVLL
jgi:hypothetical protein